MRMVLNCDGELDETRPWTCHAGEVHLLHRAGIEVGYLQLGHLGGPPAHERRPLGNGADLEEILGLVAAGEVVPPPIETWPLEDINEALESLRNSSVPSRAVVTIHSEDTTTSAHSEHQNAI